MVHRRYTRTVSGPACIFGIALVAAFAGAALARGRTKPSPHPSATTDAPEVEHQNSIEIENGSIYRRLDRNEFRHRVSESFPDIHLTTISVVQGVALALLVGNFLGFGNTEGGQTGTWRLLPYALLSLALIIAISFEYYYFVAVYRWSPKFFDTCIPYLLGVCEIGAIYHLDQPEKWWWWMSALALVASAAFLNTWANCRPTMFSTTDLYKFVKKYVTWDIIWSLAIGIVAVIVAALYQPPTPGALYGPSDLVAAPYLVGILFMSLRAHRFVRNMHRRLAPALQ